MANTVATQQSPLKARDGQVTQPGVMTTDRSSIQMERRGQQALSALDQEIIRQLKEASRSGHGAFKAAVARLEPAEARSLLNDIWRDTTGGLVSCGRQGAANGKKVDNALKKMFGADDAFELLVKQARSSAKHADVTPSRAARKQTTAPEKPALPKPTPSATAAPQVRAKVEAPEAAPERSPRPEPETRPIRKPEICPSPNTASVAKWVVAHNPEAPFIVVDKQLGTVNVFDETGKLLRKAEALVGRNPGDRVVDAPCQTKAGEFPAKIYESEDYGTTIRFDRIGNSNFLIHSVPLHSTTVPYSERMKAIATPVTCDNPGARNKTSGCINVLPDDMKEILPYFTNGGTVYVMPTTEQGKAVSEAFANVVVGPLPRTDIARN